MKTPLRMIITLAVVGLFAGGSLAFIYQWAQPQIAAYQKKTLTQAIFNVLPGTKNYRLLKKNHLEVYRCEDTSGNLLGYARVGEGGGYQDKIRVMVGVKPDLETLGGIEILYTKETPGLGGKIATQDVLQPSGKTFAQQFRGLEISPPIEYLKNKKPKEPNQIQAITGATISSRSVVKIVNKVVASLRIALGEKVGD